MTCKDCAHYEACKEWCSGIDEYIDPEGKENQEPCKHFKDKSRFVELSCKVGDTVYYITGIYNTLVDFARVEEIYYNGDDFAYGVCSDNGIYFDIQQEEIYFTYEEAEKALEGSNRK